MSSRLWSWLVQKAPEVKHLNKDDLLLAKIIARIQTEKVNQSTEYIALDKIKFIHPISRDTAKEKLADRVTTLQIAKEEILKVGKISKEMQEKYIPSATWVKVVAIPDGSYVVWEGNGRVLALQKVFTDKQIDIETEVFELEERSKIFKEIEVLQNIHGL